MRFSLTQVILIIAALLLFIALLAAAAGAGFFGNMFDGFFGPGTTTTAIRR
jgi:hypothetical protein